MATWRRPDALLRCLEGLQAQTLEPDQVLIAVREDDDATRRALADLGWERARVVLVTRPGAIAARNAAISEANTEIIAFVDDDAVPRPVWSERLVRHYADPCVGAVGGRDFVYHGGRLVEGAEPVVGRVLPYGRFVGFHHLGTGGPREVDVLKGANMSVRASALRGRGFDTELRGDGAQHHEDWALSLRIQRDGWKVIYDPAVQVDHDEAVRVGGAPRENPTGPALRDRLHNQTYTAVRYLPWPKAVAHVVFVLLVGTTVGPGLVQGVLRLRRLREAQATAGLLAASVQGRAAGIRSGLRGRLADTTLAAGPVRRRPSGFMRTS